MSTLLKASATFRPVSQRRGYGRRWPQGSASLLRHGWHAHVTQVSALESADSLTTALRALGQLRVRLQRSRVARPTEQEAAVLYAAGQPAARVWLREIDLLLNDVAVIKARSVIALSQLRKGPIQLHRQGTRPLGDVLFDDDRVARSQLVYKRRCGGLLRRGVFVTHGQVLLVQEQFLPAALAWVKS